MQLHCPVMLKLERNEFSVEL